MAKEIERRFLCKYKPIAFNEIPPIIIKQGYIFSSDDKHLRVRIENNKIASIALKFTPSIIRDEYEYEIPIKDGLEIFSKSESKLMKARYEIEYYDYHIDIDYYGKDLMVVEIELPSEDTEFILPDYFGEEITGVREYNNIYLAQSGKYWV